MSKTITRSTHRLYIPDLQTLLFPVSSVLSVVQPIHDRNKREY